MHWHIPSLEELETATRLLEKFLNREMDKLKECMDGKQFTRYVLLYSSIVAYQIISFNA